MDSAPPLSAASLSAAPLSAAPLSAASGGSVHQRPHRSPHEGRAESATATGAADGEGSEEDVTRATKAEPLGISSRETFAGLAQKTLSYVRANNYLKMVIFVLLFLWLDWIVQQPLEWLLLLVYSFVVLGRAQRLGPATVLVYVLGLSLGDYVVSTFVSQDVTAFMASYFVNFFVVIQLDGVNARGLLLLMALIWKAYKYPAVYSGIFRPIAAHCTVFGLCWLMFMVMSSINDSLEDVLRFLGLSMPQVPVVIVEEIMPTTLKLGWTYRSNSSKSCAEYVLEVNGAEHARCQPSQSSVVLKSLVPNERYMIRVGAVFPSSSSTVFSFPMFVRTLQGSSCPPTSDDFDPTDSGNGSTDNGTDGSGDRSAASSPPLPTAAPIVNNNTFESATSAAAPLIASPAASAQSAAFDASKALALQATLRDLQQHRLDSETLIKELQIQYQAELSTLEDEIQKVREAKKSEDNPKSKLKHSIKSVEEAKAKTDLARSKLEKELRSEDDLRQSQLELLEQLDRDLVRVQESVNEAEQKRQSMAEQYSSDREVIKQRLDAQHAATAEQNTKLSQIYEQVTNVEQSCVQAKERVLAERGVLSQLLQAVAGVRTREREREKYLDALKARQKKLYDENVMLQDLLRDENYRNIGLKADLSAIRQQREQQQQQQQHLSHLRNPSSYSDLVNGSGGGSPFGGLQLYSSSSNVSTPGGSGNVTPSSLRQSPLSSAQSSSSRLDVGLLSGMWGNSPTSAASNIPPQVARHLSFQNAPPPMSPDLGDFDSSLYDSLTADANDDDDVNDFHLTSSSRMFPGSSSALGAVGGSSSAIGNPTIGGGSSSNSVSSGPFSLGLSPFVWGTQN